MQVCTSSQTTMPTSHHSVFYRPDALPAAQPTASKHCLTTFLPQVLVGISVWRGGTVCSLECLELFNSAVGSTAVSDNHVDSAAFDVVEIHSVLSPLNLVLFTWRCCYFCNYILMCNILHAELDMGCWHPWVWLGCIGLCRVGSFCGFGWDFTNEIFWCRLVGRTSVFLYCYLSHCPMPITTSQHCNCN